VLPPGFQHIGGTYRSPLQGETVDLWWPLQLDISEQAQRNWHFTNAVARMKPGVSLQQADEDVKRLAQELKKRQVYTELDTRVSALTAEVVGDSKQTVWLLVSAGCLVLLIAGANVAGLSIARGLARRKEVAVRQALGASTWRLVSAILCENLALGIVGGMVGLGLTAILSPVWHALLPVDFPRVHEVKLTPSAGIFAVACALATSLCAGLVAALRKTTSDPGSPLTQESRGASAGREAHRLRTFLVASEVAFATVLCSAAALLVHSSLRLSARPQGFEPQGVLTFTLTLPGAAYSKPDQFYRFYEEVTHRWRDLPGVRAAAFGSDVPWTGYDENTSFGIPGVQEERNGGPQSRFHMASDGYFESLRIAVHKGRSFDDRDRANSPKVVVVNESLVRRYLPNGNPLGRTLDIFGDRWQIAGVAADVFDHPADPRAEPAFWFPLSQQPQNQLVAVLRTDGDPLALLSGAANVVHAFDRELAVAEVRPMYDIARMSWGERNLANWLFQAFAMLALALAVVGVYGLLSYIVEQRHKEFGIRMALGATRGSIVWLVLKNGLLQAGIGGVAGVLLAPLAERSLASLLYDVTPLDPAPLLFAPALIVSAALTASLLPAFTAARSEPGSTLRAE
jgi:putative ABC transport system permease protein